MEGKMVFHVTRSTKTGRTVNVGDFDTVEQAHAAMLEHYKGMQKRGKFWYRISEEELEEINGIMYRKLCMVISEKNGPYNKKFTGEELKTLV